LHPDFQDFSAIDRTNNHHWFGAESGRKPVKLPARVGIYVNVMQRLVYRAAICMMSTLTPKADIDCLPPNVRQAPEADMPAGASLVITSRRL
jgi:hypothetical protein